MASSHKELVAELSKHKVEVSKLRSTLNELDKEKESWFKKKEQFSAKIKDAIKTIRDNKASRDSMTQEVKGLKTKRDEINKVITSKLKELNSLKKEKIKLAKSLEIREPPSKIKDSIEKLEFKIETDPMSFDKEQALMKRIKHLKKRYEDANLIVESEKKIENASDGIKKMREEANATHKLVQEKAKQSQALHEDILKISQEIDKLKPAEEEAFKKFSELKQKFNEVNSQLKEKLKVLNEVKEKLDEIELEFREKKRMEQESLLRSKEEEVNQKIKRGEKLTTEDLLVFQKFDKG